MFVRVCAVVAARNKIRFIMRNLSSSRDLCGWCFLLCSRVPFTVDWEMFASSYMYYWGGSITLPHCIYVVAQVTRKTSFLLAYATEDVIPPTTEAKYLLLTLESL